MARPGRKKRTALFIVEIICLLLFIGGLYVYGQIDSRLNKIETPQLDESKIVTNVTAPQMSGYTTYALFGIDQRSKNAALDAQNSDTIIIASINNDTKEVKLASVYRDTLLDIGNDTYTKANAAYAYGGPEQAISMLNTMLDLKITDYVTVNFNAMVAAIDALGGLDIPLSYAEMVFMNDYCVETSQETGKSYTPVELPDPKPENEEEILGTYHLNGVQSVSYCRIRYTASMDMGRTERQRRVIGMMVDKAKSAGITTIFNIMDEVFPMISTSITKTEILNLIPTLMGYNIADTTGFPAKYKFADVKKASMVVADTLEDNVKELHKFLYGADENYQPSQNIVEANARIIELVGGADTLVDQSPIEVMKLEILLILYGKVTEAETMITTIMVEAITTIAMITATTIVMTAETTIVETIAAIIVMAVMTVEVILAAVTIMEETTAAEIIVETAPAMEASKMEADIDQ